MSSLPIPDRVRRALHALDAPPAGPCWNSEDLTDLLPESPPVAAAVLVGLVPRPAALQVLLTRRTDALRHHAGQVSFPGGRIESEDADPCAAAVRETREETGIPPTKIQPVGYLDPLATVTGFRVLPLVAVITPDYIARPDPREVDEVFEVPFDFLMAPENLRRVRIDVRGRPREVFEYVDRGIGGQRIWGASASILFNLRQRLEAAR